MLLANRTESSLSISVSIVSKEAAIPSVVITPRGLVPVTNLKFAFPNLLSSPEYRAVQSNCFAYNSITVPSSSGFIIKFQVLNP